MRETILRFYGEQYSLTHLDIFQISTILDSALCQASTVYLEKKFAKSSRELIKDNSELTKRIRGLQNFTIVAAHDLRGPLSTITSYLNLLQSELDKEIENNKSEFKLFLSKAEDTAAKLLASLDAVLRFSHAQLSQEKVCLNDIVEIAISNLSVDIASHNADVSVQPGLPMVNVDMDMMSIAFQNIITNALKYRSDEPPIVKIYAKQDKKSVNLCFEDNGVGISKKNFEKIFQSFKRGTTDVMTSISLGLGLSTCRQIIECHGGSIWAESDRNGGARFWIKLPLESETSG